MFWNKQNGNSNQNGNENGNSGGGKNGKKTWLHSPESLVNGHVAYLVKVSGQFFPPYYTLRIKLEIKLQIFLGTDFFSTLFVRHENQNVATRISI